MAHLVTRTQLARVTRLPHRPNPLFFTPKPTIYRSPTHPLLRPAMDPQPPESSVPAASAEDFVHVTDLKMESLSDSMVRIGEPSEAAAAASSAPESDRRPATLSPELSRNVLVLSCESAAEGGVCDVYLVGTRHGSEESRREVQAIVNFLKPQVVFLELCSSPMARHNKLKVLKKVLAVLKKEHDTLEVLYGWFLAKIDKELEAFRSCEFLVAYEEAIKYGGRVILGDRPVEITLRRTWSKMSLWHMTKLFLPAGFSPSFDDLDKMLKKRADSYTIALAFQEISKEFPTLMETLVYERDQYMSSRLLEVASENSSVVAVVGRGHLQGIKKHWKQPVEMKDLMTVPSLKPTYIGVAVAGVAVISGIYLSCKK